MNEIAKALKTEFSDLTKKGSHIENTMNDPDCIFPIPELILRLVSIYRDKIVVLRQVLEEIRQ
jgi:hypothetical protein